MRSAKGDGAKRLLLWRAEQWPVNHWQSLDGEDGLESGQSQRSGPLAHWRRRRLVIVMWPRALAGHPDPLTSPRFLASPLPLSLYRSYRIVTGHQIDRQIPGLLGRCYGTHQARRSFWPRPLMPDVVWTSCTATAHLKDARKGDGVG